MTSSNVSRAASRAKPRPVAAISAALIIALLLVGGYTATVAATEVAAADVTAAGDTELTITADTAAAQAVVDAQPLPTAVGWLHDEAVFTNDDTAYPLASISKLVTVLVALEAQPLAPGEDGPTYTWTDADVALQNHYISLDGVAYPIPAGTEITLRQMLTLIFLPSANDFASAYALQVFGTNEDFLAAVADWQARNGIESLTFVEPTGMDEGNQANAADLVRIARLALANPTVTQFTNLQSAELPWGIGVIENTNPLLAELPNMLGLKTGRSSSAGFNLIAAQETDAAGRKLVKISVTMGRGSVEERASSGRDMLAALEPLPQLVTLVEEGEVLGSVTTFTGEEVSVISSGSATAVLTPGESATRTLELSQPAPGAAGQAAGVIMVDSPTGSEEIAVVTAAAIEEATFWWRFTHPLELLP
ncbi:D-alanyl-D-alanine carboxypeptidase (penicillin-binding protein 5/6) [Leucobacter exalbidus]|uniref:D-alanyl-D-alanine carboxypeptidase (Penicillin-binding protein 5/6) n=1 Tax=Leucobacter exalbidus TaxID=662960 RepID=A0A940T5U2_9MICO|nr:D-alanyl-D-alanine carboxypeptidase (penicillin-binding protein 5/6) [Leucobacter exalbidus]